jgi:hypothetical protein
MGVVFVRQDQLEEKEDGLHLRLHSPGRHALWPSGTWSKYAADSVLMQMVTGVGDSPEGAAIALAKKETELAEKLRASEVAYTMVFGPGDQVVVDGKFHRRSRYVVLRGLYAASKRGLQGVPPKGRAIRPSTTRKLPPGVVYERR